MKIFLDSAEINEIKTHQNSGFVDGVTTNPSLITKSSRNILETIAEICTIYANFDFYTEVLVASVRSTQHVVDAALMGADVVTLPPKILSSLYKHPLTNSGLDAFMADWRQIGQSIL